MHNDPTNTNVPATLPFEDLPPFRPQVHRYLSEPTQSVSTVIASTLTDYYKGFLLALCNFDSGRALEGMIITRDITIVRVDLTSHIAKGPRNRVLIKEYYHELEAVPKRLFCHYPSHAFLRSRRRSNSSYSGSTGGHFSDIYGSKSDIAVVLASPKMESNTNSKGEECVFDTCSQISVLPLAPAGPGAPAPSLYVTRAGSNTGRPFMLSINSRERWKQVSNAFTICSSFRKQAITIKKS
jgi:hypothetical protein